MSPDRRDFLRSAALALAATQFGLPRSAHAQVQIPGSTGEGNTVTTADAVHPFQIEVPDEDLADLGRRIAAVRWPSKELVADRSQGVQLATIQELARYWTTDYDWRTFEASLNALPQFKTEIDGVDVHFIHVKSPHANALPVIITHGWPGSVVELLGVVGPLADPTAHGGRAEDAFDVVLPSLPGYGFSAEPTELGWYAGRFAKAWGKLMPRLGYTRYVAQGGDVGAVVTDAMGRQAPAGLVGIHTNLFAPGSAGTGPFPQEHRGGARGGRAGRHVQGGWLRLLPRAGHAPADDRLRPAGLADRAGGVDARPRHGQLLQDLERVRRRPAVWRSDPRPHPRQRQPVLADGHRGVGGAVVLGERTSRGPCGRPDTAGGLGPGRLHASSPASGSGPRAAGSRWPTRPSPISTRWTGAGISRRGKSQSCSRRSSVPRFGRFANQGALKASVS